MRAATPRRSLLTACSAALGLALVTAGMLLVTWLPRLLRSAISDSIVIDSVEHPSFADFVTNWADRADKEQRVPVKLNKFTFYRLENQKQFLFDGASPVFSRRGPYVFREFYRHHNVTFSPDRTTVSFSDSVSNHFVPELSNGSLSDRITILNLPYLKIVNRYGKPESQTLQIISALAIPKIIAELEQRMVPSIKAAAASTAIRKAMGVFWPLNGLTKDGLLRRMGGDCGDTDSQCSVRAPFKYRFLLDPRICGDDFVDSSDDDGDYTDRVRHRRRCVAEGKFVSLSTMKLLINRTDHMSPLNDESPESGAALWLSVDIENHHRLSRHFNLTLYQFARLQMWIKRVAESDTVRDGVFKQVNNNNNYNNNNRIVGSKDFRINSWNDLAIRQWYQADVIAALKKQPAPLSVQPAAPPEFAFSIVAEASDWPEWDVNTVACIVDNFAANKSFVLLEFFGINYPATGKHFDFLREDLDQRQPERPLASCFTGENSGKSRQALSRYFKYGSKSFSASLFRNAIAAGSGILMERTVRDHVLGAEEPLLRQLLDDSDPRYHAYSLLPNDHSLDLLHDCHSAADLENDYTSCQLVPQQNTIGERKVGVKRYVRRPSTFYTGVGNISRIGQMVAFNGERTVSGVFGGGALQIEGGANNLPDSVQYGFSIGMSFPPFGQIGEAIYVFIPAISNPLRLKRQGKVEDLYGLSLTRYILPALENFSHMRSSWAPLVVPPTDLGEYMSLRDAKQMPLYASASEAESFIDVEPITGKTMRLCIRMIVSASTNSTDFDVFYPKLFKAEHLPVFEKEVTGTVDEFNAGRFKSSVYTARYFIDYGSVIAVVLGALLMGFALVQFLSKSANATMDVSNDEEDGSSEPLFNSLK